MYVHGKIIQKDADQCINKPGIDWNQLTSISLSDKALGLVPHGYEGVGAEAVKEFVELFGLKHVS